MNILVTYKNFILYKQGKTIKKFRISDIETLEALGIDTKELIIKVNKQWLSEKNRYQLEKLSKGHIVENNTLYPIDDLEKHYNQVIEFVSRKKVSLKMDDKDIKILNELIAKYNKSTINKYTRKI